MNLDRADAPPVVIVGGGPIGLAASVLLDRLGVASLVVERRSTASCGQSRAVTIQRDVLAIYDRLGIAEEIIDAGASWSLGRTFYGDTEVLQVSFGQDEAAVYPPFVNFPQYRIEELLHAKAMQAERIRVLNGASAEVLDDGADADHALVRITAADGTVRLLSARYVIAADGVRSPTRKSLDIDFEGWRTDGRFLVADFAADLPFASERRLWFSPPFHPEGIVLMHNIGRAVWRLDWQIPADLDVEREVASGRVVERIRAALDHAGAVDTDINVLRCNGYTFQQRRASRFRQGRVFLAGDAAHVVSPFGARGMNSGMEDAENLAWKLATVLSGAAPARLLESYAEEREAAATHHVHITGESMRFMTPGSAEGLAERNAILAAALADPEQAHRVNSGRLYTPHPYATSSLTTPTIHTEGHRRPVPGDLIPDVRVTAGGSPSTLRRTVAGRFAVVRRDPDAPGRLLIDQIDGTGRSGTTSVDTRPDDVDRIVGPLGDVAHLVRPDCYLAAVVGLDDDASWDEVVRSAWRRATAHEWSAEALLG